MTLSGADIAQLLSAHGLKPSRALGQNFVADPNTVRRIARLSGAGPGSDVLEIGAGLGSLTLALAETGARVVAVETDRRLVPVLRSVVAEAGVETHRGGRPRAGPVGAPGRAEPRPLEPGGQPSLQRGHAPGAPGPGGGARGGPPPRHGAAGGGRAAGGVCGRGGLRGGLGPIAYFARAEVVGRRRLGLRAAATGRVGPGPAGAPCRAGRRSLPGLLRPAERGRPGRLRQRRKMLRRSLAGVVDPAAFERAGVGPMPGRRSSTWRPGAGWRHCDRRRL